jgi:hypothetical protein
MSEVLTNLLGQIPPGTAEVAGVWLAALLTLAVLSYILGNNPFFRLAEYLFVGMAAGYAGALAWNQILWPRLELLINDPVGHWPYGVFFLLGILLLTRGARRIAVLGNLPLGVLFGTGAALAIGGALTGSLVPQMQASIVSLSPAAHTVGLARWTYVIDAVLLVLGTLAVLSVFHFRARPEGTRGNFFDGLLKGSRGLGRGVIMITFGALLAGALMSFFAILLSRLDFLVNDWIVLFSRMGL